MKKNIYFSEEDTRILCSKNQVLNVRYTGKQFRKRQGRMSDFPVVQYNRIYPKSTNKPEVAYAKGHWGTRDIWWRFHGKQYRDSIKKDLIHG